MKVSQRISPCLWFDDQAEAAAKFYTGIFKNSKITQIARYSEVGKEHHHKPPGSVMTVAFELDGLPVTALNGGPIFKFNEAISLQIYCDYQEEVDHYWSKLTAGGQEQPCGWLKDKFGVSWQVVPKALIEMATDPDAARAARATQAMFQMKKIDVATIRRATPAELTRRTRSCGIRCFPGAGRPGSSDRETRCGASAAPCPPRCRGT
jgi:predicted 3-demethylubiquinone-9 3-methyltransferase (glyoxalase superfamily)